jgi:type II secretory pathway pseudopilin PulG
LAGSKSQRGATLLEVMVALGIIATAYVALIGTQSASVRLSTYGKQVTVAAFLAQAKMEEWEQKLEKDGFPDMDETESEDFEELGYPNFSWKLEIKKVELPVGAAFEQLLSSFGGGEDGEGGAASMLGQLGGAEGLLSGQLGQLAKSKLGGAGGAAGAAGLLNPDMLRGSVESLTTMLQEAIREVTLTVTWGEGGEDEQLVVTTHLVRVPRAPAAAGTGQTAPAGAPLDKTLMRTTAPGGPGVRTPVQPIRPDQMGRPNLFAPGARK